MKTSSWNTFAAFVWMAMQAGNLPAQDVAKPEAVKVDETKTEQTEAVKSVKPTRAELRDKQLDVSLEARDIERILGKLKKASELSKQRITEAAKSSETASTSLDKGDSKAARVEAQQTAEMFREIAKQLEALLKEETPQRIAEARQLAQQLAKAEKEFAEKFQGALNPTQATSGQGKVDPKSQVKPLTDPDMKMQGSGGKTQKGGGGKNQTEKNQEPRTKDQKEDGAAKDQTEKDQEPRTKDQKGNGAAKDQENGDKPEPNEDGKNGGEKPRPDGQGGEKPEDKDKGGDKKPGSDDMPNGGKEGDDKKPGGGAGQDKKTEGDDEKSGGTGSAKDKKDGDKKDGDKTGEDQDGSGGDKPNDKTRQGSGGGSDKDAQNDKNRNGGGASLTPEQLREMVADRADKLADSGRTLQDVLNEIAKSTDPADKEAVAKIQAVMKEIDINKIVAEMGEVSNMIRSKNDDDAKLSSLDVAERLQIMAQRLDAAYRGIVAPQAEELRKLEQALADLREQLEKLETPSQVAAWHRDARELLDKLDKLGVNMEAREEFEKEMKKAGFGVDVDRTKRTLNWGLINGRYEIPASYNAAIIHLQEDVQERIQTLILGDLGNVSDDATPPKYQELVEKYYEVLSRTSAGKSEARKSKPETKAKAK